MPARNHFPTQISYCTSQEGVEHISMWKEGNKALVLLLNITASKLSPTNYYGWSET